MSAARESTASEAELFTSLLDDWIAQTKSTTVTVVADSDAALADATLAAEALGSRAKVRVARDWADCGPCDLVAVARETSHVAWAAHLVELGKLAGKALVVVVRNPRGLLDRGDALAPMCHTKAIAPVLWQIGRVREHVYFHPGRLALAAQLAPRLRDRVARLHGFLVDTTPRTPQARRKLHTVT